MSSRSVKDCIFFFLYAYRMLKCLQKQTVSIVRCKTATCKISLHHTVSQNLSPEHRQSFLFQSCATMLFKETPSVCVEQTDVIWTHILAFLVADCDVEGLPGAQGGWLGREMVCELDLSWVCIQHSQWEDWWKRFLKDTSETRSPPFLLPGKLPPTAQQLGQTHSTFAISRGGSLQELEVLTANWQLIWNRTCKSVVLKFGS